MQLTKFAVTLAAWFLTSGCSSVVSLHPFVSDREAVADPALAGVWSDRNEENTYLVQQFDTGYKITVIGKDSQALKFEARMMQAGDARLLDLVSVSDDPFQVPVHTIVRVWPGGSTLKLAFLDSPWLQDQVRRHLAAETVKDRLMILSTGESVREFLVKYGAQDKAYGDVELLSRVR